MRPMSPTSTMISTAMVSARDVPIMNSTQRFASLWFGRRMRIAAQNAIGRAINEMTAPR